MKKHRNHLSIISLLSVGLLSAYGGGVEVVIALARCDGVASPGLCY